MIHSNFRRSLVLLAVFFPLVYSRCANAVNVYWDISHGVVDNYKPTGRYSVLVNHLAPAGFSFTEGTVPLNDAPLDDFQILVLANGSFANTFPSVAEVESVEAFLGRGGSLLVMSEIAGASGTVKIQQFASIFGAQVGLADFPSSDVFSTSITPHPAVANVNSMYLRFSSTISPGELTSYVFHDGMPMLAAGDFSAGRIVLIADGDLFTAAPGVPVAYIDRADNRQLASSVFAYLAIPEPSTIMMSSIFFLAMIAHRLRTA